jgi:hypothetical protein
MSAKLEREWTLQNIYSKISSYFWKKFKIHLMAKSISQYFKRIFDDYQVLVQVNPDDFTGIELIVHPDGKLEKTLMEFDEEIFEDLEADEFKPCGALEFQLQLAKSLD